MESKVSPITLGLLALLAYRTYQGKGRLADMLGRGQPQPGGNAAAPAPAAPGGGLGDILGGLLGGGAGASNANTGGLGDILGSILGGNAPGRTGVPGQAPGTQSGNPGGSLGGLLAGGALGGLLSGGLGSLLEQFEQKGQGAAAGSWVGTGDNQPISPGDLEHAVGRDALEELARHSGRPYDDVVSELTSSLPGVVDQLTPEGRLPSEHEAGRWL